MNKNIKKDVVKKVSPRKKLHTEQMEGRQLMAAGDWESGFGQILQDVDQHLVNDMHVSEGVLHASSSNGAPLDEAVLTKLTVDLFSHNEAGSLVNKLESGSQAWADLAHSFGYELDTSGGARTAVNMSLTNAATLFHNAVTPDEKMDFVRTFVENLGTGNTDVTMTVTSGVTMEGLLDGAFKVVEKGTVDLSGIEADLFGKDDAFVKSAFTEVVLDKLSADDFVKDNPGSLVSDLKSGGQAWADVAHAFGYELDTTGGPRTEVNMALTNAATLFNNAPTPEGKLALFELFVTNLGTGHEDVSVNVGAMRAEGLLDGAFKTMERGAIDFSGIGAKLFGDLTGLLTEGAKVSPVGEDLTGLLTEGSKVSPVEKAVGGEQGTVAKAALTPEQIAVQHRLDQIAKGAPRP